VAHRVVEAVEPNAELVQAFGDPRKVLEARAPRRAVA
jgi:hypothetical protein